MPGNNKMTLTCRTVPNAIYGMLMKHVSGDGQTKRDKAARLLWVVDNKLPDGSNVFAWVQAGLKSGWLFDNQPGQVEYELWASKVFGKRVKPQPKKAGDAMRALFRELAEK